MIEGKIRYWDLGRGKAEGQLNIVARDEDDFNNQLEKEFRKHLVSDDISFDNGIIYAGFHSVGRFEFIAKVGEEDG
jgi:hypothetical protein